MKRILLILALICVMVLPVFSQTGNYTTNKFFYLPEYGAYGKDEFNEYNKYMQIADTQIEANKTTFGSYYLKTEIDTLGEVEIIYSADITDSTELATALTDYYLKTAIDTQGEVETIWGVTLATDSELSTALTDYYLKTAIDTQGEVETIWGVSLANDGDSYLKTEMDSESELEGILSDVSDIFTDTSMKFIDVSQYTGDDIGAKINAAITAGKKYLFVPPGTYEQTTKIENTTNGVFLWSIGSGIMGQCSATIKKQSDIISLESSAVINIKGIDFDGSDVADVDDSTSGVVLHYKSVFMGRSSYHGGNGLELTVTDVAHNCNGTIVEGRFDGNEGSGIHIEDTHSVAAPDTNIIQIRYVICRENTDAGLKLLTGSYNHIYGQFDGNNYGVYVSDDSGANSLDKNVFDIYCEGNITKDVYFATTNSANKIEGRISTYTVSSDNMWWSSPTTIQGSANDTKLVVLNFRNTFDTQDIEGSGVRFVQDDETRHSYIYGCGDGDLELIPGSIAGGSVKMGDGAWTNYVNVSNSGVLTLEGTASINEPLSILAATTSAELAGVISDETGSGLLVYGTSPNITTPTGIVKGDVGLGNCDNTSDVNKPVSTASQTALDLKANIASPTFTGTVTIPTPFTLGAVSVLPTGTELNFVDGVTSAIQTQLNAKEGTLTNEAGLYAVLSDVADFVQGAEVNSIDSGMYVDTSIDHEHLSPDVITGLAEVTSTDLDMVIVADQSDSWALKKVDMGEVRGAGGGGYTDLTEFVEQTAWRVFYSNTDGDVVELPFGADGTYLSSNGASAVPTFETGSDVTNWVIPQDYATGAGTSGDPWAGTCIEDAFAAASAGDTIYLRAGYYQMGGTLSVNKAISIIGEGMGKTFILTADAKGFDVVADYVTFKNLTVDGAAQTHEAYKHCIGIDDCDFAWIENVEVKESGWCGINNFESNYSTYINIYAHDNFHHGVHPGTNVIGKNKWNTYRDIYCYDNTDSGFKDRGIGVNEVPEEEEYNVFDNIQAWSNGERGIEICGQKAALVSNCSAYDNGTYGWFIWEIEDSNFVNCNASLNDDQGFYIDNVKNVNFTNCVVRSNNMDGDANITGISISTSEGVRFVNCHSFDDRSVVGEGDIAFVDGGVGADTITMVSAAFLSAGFVAGDVITISGSASNDGNETIVSVVAGTITLATGTLVAEAVGATVTITAAKLQTHGIYISNTADYVEFINCDFRGNLTGRINYATAAKFTGIDAHTLTGDHDYSGKWEAGIVGETVVFGQLLYFNWIDKEWKETDADATATMPGLRIALDSKADGETCILLVEGDIRDDSAYEFAASMVYASCTVGGITSTAPSASGDQVQRLGVAESADIFYFDPSIDQGEI